MSLPKCSGGVLLSILNLGLQSHIRAELTRKPSPPSTSLSAMFAVDSWSKKGGNKEKHEVSWNSWLQCGCLLISCFTCWVLVIWMYIEYIDILKCLKRTRYMFSWSVTLLTYSWRGNNWKSMLHRTGVNISEINRMNLQTFNRLDGSTRLLTSWSVRHWVVLWSLSGSLVSTFVRPPEGHWGEDNDFSYSPTIYQDFDIIVIICIVTLVDLWWIHDLFYFEIEILCFLASWPFKNLSEIFNCLSQLSEDPSQLDKVPTHHLPSRSPASQLGQNLGQNTSPLTSWCDENTAGILHSLIIMARCCPLLVWNTVSFAQID